MTFLEKVKMVLGLLPVIIDTIKAIENAIPVEGKGKDKLELVKNVLQTTFETSNQSLELFQDVWPTLQSVISAVVATFNTLGIFKNK
uniref:Uncharacterized protein n=1 Tax=viral metagenome TaxID=1070528 RepID=A0A6C0JVN6_9ZZZZ